MTMPLHIDLHVADAPPGATQPVEVEQVGPGTFRVLYTPGFVEGVAAGDTIRLVDRVLGTFEVVSRGGNLAVKLWGPRDPRFNDASAATHAELASLSARCDGSIAGAAVWTVPLTSGFAAVERAMSSVVGRFPECQWTYGNVYNSDGEPLGWWDER